jgi:hypothetical protein
MYDNVNNQDSGGPTDVFGSADFDEEHGCYMVNVHRSEHEQVTTKVLNILTDGSTNRSIIDQGIIVDIGAAVTLTNLGAVDSRRIVED